MEIFGVDVIIGVVAVLSICLSALGFLVWRYRGGNGPRMMFISGLTIFAGCLNWFIDMMVTDHSLSIYSYFLWSAGVTLTMISLVIWRRGS